MTSELLFILTVSLLKAQAAISFACVLVLCLRSWSRRFAGAEVAYALWTLVPLAAVASLFPTYADVVGGVWGLRLTLNEYSAAAFWSLAPTMILPVWFSGSAVFIAVMMASEHRFQRMAKRGEVGPAVAGVGWMRLVTPSGYEAKFTPQERELVRRHERAHIQRDDPLANLLILAIQAISWFNPLVHRAAVAARIDQELACDEAVVRAEPRCRRTYAATLLKAQLIGRVSPLACAWTPWARHPLELRLEMLKGRPISLARRTVGGAAVAGVALALVAGVCFIEPQCLLNPSSGRRPLHSERMMRADIGRPSTSALQLLTVRHPFH